MEAVKTTSLLPGINKTLHALRRTGMKIGLCTVNGEASTEYILSRFAIRSFFDAVVPRNKVKNVKPDSEHLQSLLATLQVDATEATAVGDGVNDMKCARVLGAVAVGLLTGVSTRDKLISAGANYVITWISDLPRLIIQIKGNINEKRFKTTQETR